MHLARLTVAIPVTNMSNPLHLQNDLDKFLQYAVKGTSSEESNDHCQCQKQPWKVSAWEHTAQKSMIGEQHVDFMFPDFACETRRAALRLYDTFEELQGWGGLPIMIVP